MSQPNSHNRWCVIKAKNALTEIDQAAIDKTKNVNNPVSIKLNQIQTELRKVEGLIAYHKLDTPAG